MLLPEPDSQLEVRCGAFDLKLLIDVYATISEPLMLRIVASFTGRDTATCVAWLFSGEWRIS